jgi:hypothetical protein
MGALVPSVLWLPGPGVCVGVGGGRTDRPCQECDKGVRILTRGESQVCQSEHRGKEKSGCKHWVHW